MDIGHKTEPVVAPHKYDRAMLNIGFDNDSIIKLDIDSKPAMVEFKKRLSFFCHESKIPFEILYAAVYKTKHGFHIYLKPDSPTSNVELMLLQALLGDDYRRAMFNVHRMYANSNPENILFSEKYDHNLKPLSRELLDEQETYAVMEIIKPKVKAYKALQSLTSNEKKIS